MNRKEKGLSENPLVTIYMPTHNRSDMLKEAIGSVLEQSYESIELIVVDDGSTDDTVSVLSQFEKEAKVRWVQNTEPQGACAARNRAIALANGELITGLDDDDLFTPHRIANLVDRFVAGDYSAVASCIEEVTSRGSVRRSFDAGEVTLNDLLFYNVLGNQVLTKTSYLRGVGGFDVNMPSYQDYDTWLRLVNRFGPAYKVQECSYVWRTAHEKGRITTNSEKKIRGMEMWYSKHKGKMNSAHQKTYQIMVKRWKGASYTFRNLIGTIHWKNWRQAVSLYVTRSHPSIYRLFSKITGRA